MISLTTVRTASVGEERAHRVFEVAGGDIGAEPGIVGKVPDHLVETLQAIYDAGSITSAALATRLGLNHTACNTRSTRLAKLGLIHRRIETAAPGGRQYTYERIV